MKSESQTPFDAAADDGRRLDACLRTWKIEQNLPSGFASQVWRQVRGMEGVELPVGTILYALASRIFTALSQPRWALVCIVFFLVLGICSGWMSARTETQRVNHVLSERYVSMFGPDHSQH